MNEEKAHPISINRNAYDSSLAAGCLYRRWRHDHTDNHYAYNYHAYNYHANDDDTDDYYPNHHYAYYYHAYDDNTDYDYPNHHYADYDNTVRPRADICIKSC